jgi:hypothetical protein
MSDLTPEPAPEPASSPLNRRNMIAIAVVVILAVVVVAAVLLSQPQVSDTGIFSNIVSNL